LREGKPMKKTYYLFNPGRVSRKDNTLKLTPVDEHGGEGTPKFIPVESVSDLYIFGSLDSNSALFNFLGKESVSVHFFDYYENYTGSFLPKDYLLAGKMVVQQVAHYQEPSRRLAIARKFVEGAAFNMLKNLRYYERRERDLETQIDAMQQYSSAITNAQTI